ARRHGIDHRGRARPHQVRSAGRPASTGYGVPAVGMRSGTRGSDAEARRVPTDLGRCVVRSTMKASLVSLAVLLAIACWVSPAHADPDPKRKVIVLEYRAGSSALSGMAVKIVGTLSKQTSLDVLGPDQTRAVFGDHLEQAIVKCAGEADCIAHIGQKVGAAEVILIGSSELRD